MTRSIAFMFLFLGLITLPGSALAQASRPVKVDTTENKPTIEKDVFVAGLGYGVETGVLGVQYRRLLSQNWFLQASGFTDVLGPGWGAGLGFQTDPKASECFWFFDCQKRMRFSVSSLQYSGRDVNLSTSGETECEGIWCVSVSEGVEGATYKASSSQAVSATVAWQDEFSTSLFYELQLGYWSMTKKPTFDYKNGPRASKDEGSLEDMTKAHVALGINLGFYF